MRNNFRKGLTLLMILCLLVPLFGVPVLAENAESLPIDYQFKDVDLPGADGAQALAAGMTNDPYSSEQWGMKMIGMEAAWQSGLTGRGVRVAIVDCGVSTRTNDIHSSRLLAGKNLLEPALTTEDTHGHGTFIAGIIGAAKDNGVGIAGIAPGVTIVPLKTTDNGTSNSDLVAQAIYDAVDEFDCSIINLSFGSKTQSTAMHDAIRYAVENGAIVVASTGNDGSTALHYPGAYSEVIGVGSVRKNMERSSFSHQNSSIFVVAPGDSVISLGMTSGAVKTSGGTSYAAPNVTGIAALLKEAHPEMNADDFRAILQAFCYDLGEAGYDTSYGWGLVQAPRAIVAAAEYFGTTAPEMPEISDPTPEPTPEPTPDPGSSGSIWDLFNFNWLRELFQNIIRSLFRGWATNLSF